MKLLEAALLALAISVIAGIAGYTGIARGAATTAKALFVVFLSIALVLFALVVFGFRVAS